MERAGDRPHPALLGIFSLVTLLAHRLLGEQPCPTRTAAWYHKPEPTFSDTLAFVRRHLWVHTDFRLSPPESDSTQVPPEFDGTQVPRALADHLCYAA